MRSFEINQIVGSSDEAAQKDRVRVLIE